MTRPGSAGAGTVGGLVWFDLTRGLPVVAGLVKERLGVGAAARLLPALAWRNATRDPFAALERAPRNRQEELTRHQLRSVLLLDDALGEVLGLDAAERNEMLADIVAGTGARFLASRFPRMKRAEWLKRSQPDRQALVAAVVESFFNVEGRVVATGDDLLAFDVDRCLFVELCAELGRPGVASLFCAADSVYFSQVDAPVRLERSGTLATGAPCCDFRFTFREER